MQKPAEVSARVYLTRATLLEVLAWLQRNHYPLTYKMVTLQLREQRVVVHVRDLVEINRTDSFCVKDQLLTVLHPETPIVQLDVPELELALSANKAEGPVELVLKYRYNQYALLLVVSDEVPVWIGAEEY